MATVTFKPLATYTVQRQSCIGGQLKHASGASLASLSAHVATYRLQRGTALITRARYISQRAACLAISAIFAFLFRRGAIESPGAGAEQGMIDRVAGGGGTTVVYYAGVQGSTPRGCSQRAAFERARARAYAHTAARAPRRTPRA